VANEHGRAPARPRVRPPPRGRTQGERDERDRGALRNERYERAILRGSGGGGESERSGAEPQAERTSLARRRRGCELTGTRPTVTNSRRRRDRASSIAHDDARPGACRAHARQAWQALPRPGGSSAETRSEANGALDLSQVRRSPSATERRLWRLEALGEEAKRLTSPTRAHFDNGSRPQHEVPSMSVSEPARSAGEPYRRAEDWWRRSPVMTVGTGEREE